MDETIKSFQLSPPPDKNHHKRVILYGIGAILLLIIGGAIGFIFSYGNISSNIPPSNSLPITNSWQTYTDKEGIFTIKYPSNYFASNIDDGIGDSSVVITNEKDMLDDKTPCVNDCFRLVITTSPYTTPTKIISSLNTMNLSNPTQQAISVNNYNGILGKTSSDAGSAEIVFLNNPTGGYAKLSLEYSLKSETENIDIFNSILSTFKFIQTHPSVIVCTLSTGIEYSCHTGNHCPPPSYNINPNDPYPCIKN